MNRASLTLVGLLLLGSITATVSPAESIRLTPEAIVDLKVVRQVAVAPDSATVAYTLEVPRAADDDPGRSWVELWVSAADRAPRRYAGRRERISAPAWSPDGSRLTFLSDRDADPDHPRRGLWSLPAQGGEAQPLCEHEGSIQQYSWSPDGGSLALLAQDVETEQEREAKKAGRDWVVHDEKQRYTRVWLCNLDSGEVQRAFDHDLDVSSLSWAPDGKRIVFQAAESTRVDDEMMFSKIYRAKLGEPARPLAPSVGKLGALAVSPDGSTVAFLGASSLNDPLPQSLFVVSSEGGIPRNLTQGYDGSASDLAWLDDNSLLVIAAEGSRHAAYRVSARSGERSPLGWPTRVVSDLDVSSDGKAVAAVVASAEHPSELYVATEGGMPDRRTRHNPSLDGVLLARQEVARWKGADDWPMSGVLTYPLEYNEGERYPLVLQIHGGPEGVSLDGWTTSSGYPVQLLAERGYFVLQPNYRGSQGHGVAFSKADHDDLGGKEFEDVLAGVDSLIARGLVDGSRVGTGGWSYGGYMSAWAATRHSERFRASVVAAGLTNWISFAGTTDIPYEMSLVHWDSWWFDEPELHWARSPLAHLKQAQTPTLIVHGAKDDRVHPEQGLQLYTALRIKGVPTSLVVYPREPHGLNERAHRLDYIERVLAWFDEHLGEQEN